MTLSKCHFPVPQVVTFACVMKSREAKTRPALATTERSVVMLRAGKQ